MVMGVMINNSKEGSVGVDVIPEKISVYDTEELAKNAGKKKSFFEKLGLIEQIEEQEKVTGSTQSPSNQLHNYEETELGNDNIEEVYNEPSNKMGGKIEKLSIEEIYTIFSLLPKNATNTVYLIDNFLNALPNNLPNEIKRQSLDSLLAASHINLSDLLSDGQERIDIMKDYLENFTIDLEEVISDNEKFIAELERKIAYHKEIIKERSNTLEDQKSIVKFEIQKISSIMDFVKK